MQAVKNKSSLVLNSLYESDDRIYYRYKGIAFGSNKATELDFVEIHEKQFTIQDIDFKREGASLKIKAGDLDVLQGEAFILKAGKKHYFCINSPFSGLGKSGSYQNWRAAIVFPFGANQGSDFVGVVGIVK